MPIEWFTGFEGATSSSDARALFDDVIGGNPGLESGFMSGKSYGADGYLYDDDIQYIKNVTASKTKAMGCHIYSASTSTTDDEFIFHFVGPNVKIYNTSSGLYIKVNGTGLTTVGSQISADWNHIEAELFSDATVGYLTIKVNGGLVCNLQDINTVGSDITQVRWGHAGSNYTRIDNIYIASSLQGEVISKLLLPDSDSSVSCSPLSGENNFSMLSSNDGDTSYVISAESGDKDIYGIPDIPDNYIPLFVSMVYTSKKVGDGYRGITPIMKQGDTEYDIGPTTTVDVSYSSVQVNSPLAPDGSIWTKDIINSLEIGFSIV